MDLSTPIKPKVSLWLRIRKYSKVSRLLKTKDKGNDKGKQVERSEDEGKLAALLDITLDVFFEVRVHMFSSPGVAKLEVDCNVPATD